MRPGRWWQNASILFGPSSVSVERGADTFLSVRATIGQHGRDRSPQDLQIETHGPIADVMQVKSHHIVERHLAAATDLPQAGQARHRAQAPQVPILVLLNLTRER